jgi:ribosomal-protein-alanine N-acetyltransferase
MVSPPESIRCPDWCWRTMAESDLDQVLVIENAGQPAPWSRKVFEDCLKAGYLCRVVETQGHVVAFLVVSRVLDEAHLLNIVVAPDWQRRGLAGSVMQALLEDMRHEGMALMYLEVRQHNPAARRLYQSLGFAANGYRRDYYRTADGSREDAILMVRELAASHK